MRNCIILLLAAFVTAPAISADLPIGAMRFTLGAEQSGVMQEVRARFHVVPLQGSSETFFLSEAKPPNVRVLGAIRFANGRLTWAQRNWGQFEGKVNSTEVSRTLFAAIESATASISARIAPHAFVLTLLAQAQNQLDNARSCYCQSTDS